MNQTDATTTRFGMTEKRLTANPNLWHQFMGEVFKWRRHRLFQVVVYSPFIMVVAIVFGTSLTLQGSAGANPPNIDAARAMTLGPATYDLGEQGAFAITFQAFTSGFLVLFTFGYVLACVWCVYNEFNWKTIKMIASRQPSRAQIVLSKVLFVAGLTIVCFVSLCLAWMISAVFLKLAYRVPFALTTFDVEAIGKGLVHLSLRSLANFVWGLLAMAAAYGLKSVAGGFIVYMVYTTVEGVISNIGAFATNNTTDLANVEGLFAVLLDIARLLYPHLLTSHLNRVTMLPASPQVVASLPVVASWLGIGAYVVIFIGLTMLIFIPRDIRE